MLLFFLSHSKRGLSLQSELGQFRPITSASLPLLLTLALPHTLSVLRPGPSQGALRARLLTHMQHARGPMAPAPTSVYTQHSTRSQCCSHTHIHTCGLTRAHTQLHMCAHTTAHARSPTSVLDLARASAVLALAVLPHRPPPEPLQTPQGFWCSVQQSRQDQRETYSLCSLVAMHKQAQQVEPIYKTRGKRKTPAEDAGKEAGAEEGKSAEAAKDEALTQCSHVHDCHCGLLWCASTPMWPLLPVSLSRV